MPNRVQQSDIDLIKEITAKTKESIENQQIVTPGDYFEIFLKMAENTIVDERDFSFLAQKTVDMQFDKLNKFKTLLTETYAGLAKNVEAARNAMVQNDQEKLSVIIQESEALKRKLSELQEMAYTDPLTGAKNRRWFFEEYVNADGVFIKKGIIAIVDLNDFKIINDNFGHSAGDKVLKMVSKTFGNAFKNIIRYGGDEFLVIDGEDNAVQMQKRIGLIKDALEDRAIIYSGKTFKIHFSIGFAVFRIGDCVEDILNEIDNRMYENKKQNNRG